MSKLKDINRISTLFGVKKYVSSSIITDSRLDTFNVYYQMPPGYNNGYQYLFKWNGKESQEGGKNLYIIESTDPDNFDATRYYKSFPHSKILIQRHGLLHIISVK